MSDMPTMAGARDARLYKHSGQFSATGVTIGALASIAAGAILGIAYAYVVSYCPIVYLNILLCVGFGAILAAIISKIAMAFKSRNVGVVMLMVLASGAISLYVSWAAWVNVTFNRFGGENVQGPGIFELVKDPELLWEGVEIINEAGVWSIGHSGQKNEPVKGIALWIVWGGEVVLLLGAALKTTLAMGGKPFCEECENWCEKHPKIVRINVIPGQETNEFVSRLWAGDFGMMLSAGWALPEQAKYYLVEMECCPQCGGTNTMTVKESSITGTKGKTKENSKTLLNKMLISREETAAVKAIFDQLTTPAA